MTSSENRKEGWFCGSLDQVVIVGAGRVVHIRQLFSSVFFWIGFFLESMMFVWFRFCVFL